MLAGKVTAEAVAVAALLACAGARAGAPGGKEPPTRGESPADAEGRLDRLERRLTELEEDLRAKDEEIERLRRMLEEGDRSGEALPRQGAPQDRPLAEPFRGRPPQELLEDWRDRLDEMNDRMREELEEWGLEWGLPGHERRRRLAPRELAPWPAGRAFLGIEMEHDGGVRVRRVLPDTPAKEAGLLPGDLIIRVDGREVAAPGEVARIVGAKRPGDALTLAILRDGAEKTLTATLAEPPGDGRRGPFPAPRWNFGRGPFNRWSAPLPPPRELPGPAAAEENTVRVEVPLADGRATVNVTAPGLHLAPELADRLGLSEKERRDVRAALAEAREEFAAALAEEIRRRDGDLDGEAVAELRREAEREARRRLSEELDDEKLAALERAQERAASGSSLSISVTRGRGDGPHDRDRNKEPKGWPELPEEGVREF